MEVGSTGSRPVGEALANFQLYSWETYKPVSGLLPQPEWTAWDQTVEYCALAYHDYVVISSLRPQYRYLGDVAIGQSTGGVWHRRQLFLATPTTIECVFVDAGVTAVDVERKRRKEELKAKEVQQKAITEHGELALITVDSSQPVVQERAQLRPPMLQVVRLASFQHAPSVPPFISLAKQSKVEVEDTGASKDAEERKPVSEVAVAGGGVSVAVSRLPSEQKRPVGPLVVVGVRDGVLWLVDRYMTAHAIGLGHPGIRCRCLAAYGDAVSAVKWATRLGREHHDDFAQFMLGMGYATEALHLPGISKRLEFDLALKSNDLKRALQCLLTLSNSRTIMQDVDSASDVTEVLNLASSQENLVDAVQGIIKFAKEFLELIDAADATGQTDIAAKALRRLAAAGAVKGALQPHDLRGLALRLAAHGQLTRLGVLVNTMIAAGQGREAALAAALLGDSALLEKSLQETGMYAEAALHAQAHGRPSLKSLIQLWNEILQKELKVALIGKMKSATNQMETLTSAQKTPALQDLTEGTRRPLIEIIPPGSIISTPGQVLSNLAMGTVSKASTTQQTISQPSKPLLLEAPPLSSTTNEVMLSSPLIAGPTSLSSSFTQKASLSSSVAHTADVFSSPAPVFSSSDALIVAPVSLPSAINSSSQPTSSINLTPAVPIENTASLLSPDNVSVTALAGDPLLDIFFS
eukprot:c29047_g1_i1 orf=2584-4665(+)